jgi:hypothetical protein
MTVRHIRVGVQRERQLVGGPAFVNGLEVASEELGS